MARPNPKRAATRDCVVIYCRVSTDEQVSSGAGLAAQEAECRRYAEAQGWTVADVVIEGAVSGKVSPFKRPGFQLALAQLDECEAGTLLVRRDDRLSRRLKFQLAVVEHATEHGWAIATTDRKFDTSTAAGRLDINLRGSIAQYEVDVIGERTREALAARKEAGARLGRPATLPSEVVELVVAKRDQGHTWQSIADQLAALGTPTARGGKCWRVSTVQGVYRTAQLDKHAELRRAQL